MNNFRKAIALLLSVCLLSGATLALAEAAGSTQTATDATTGDVTQAVATTAITLADTDVVAKVKGTDVTGAAVKVYYQYLVQTYGEPDATSLDLYYAVAMQQAVVEALAKAVAIENGLDKYTDEELSAVYAKSDADWQAALDNYVQQNSLDTSTDAAKTTAYTAAETYYTGLGYDKDKLRAQYLESSTYDRVQALVCKDVTTTDEEVQAKYDENVAADKVTYENDAQAYENQLLMVQYGYATDKPWYHPVGYRFIKHILLPVDTALMTAYTDLTAKLEEQMNSDAAAAATTEPSATPEVTVDPNATAAPTEVPVTQADVDTAKANIIASIQDKITEINGKIAAGSDFDALIAEYGVKADGTATDPGMTSGTYPNGYEVSTYSSSFVPEFVAAAFSVDKIGDVSAPYVSSYGVHIAKYVGDVPAGPVELTDTLKETIRTELQSAKESAAMDAWQKAAGIEYTGVLKTLEEVQAATAAETADEATAATDTAAPETTVAEPTATPAA